MAKARRRQRVKTPPLLFERTQAVLKKIQAQGRRRPPHLLDVHQRLRLRQRRHGAAGPAAGDRAPAAPHAAREVGRRQRDGRAADGPSPAPVRATGVTVLAPLNCASAATMLALGADRIGMGPLSYLTAVDTSLEHELSPRRPHEPARGGEQRRGGARHPALEGERGPRAAAPSTRTRSCTSTSTRWSSAPSTAPAASPSCSAARSSATT